MSETTPSPSMSRRRETTIFWLLILAGAVLRLARLGTLPPALFRDEAEKAYNAYCLLKTGCDISGHFLPLFINVYGVTTSAIYQYAAVPFMGMLGMNEWSARMPAAFAGIAAIVVNYALLRRERGVSVALWATFFLAFSPWHIVFSRWAQQGIFLPLLLAMGALGLRRFLDGCRAGLPVAAAALAVALYAYEVARVFVPLLLVWMLLLYWREFRARWKQTVVSLGVLGLLSMPVLILLTTQTAEAQARFNKISIFQPDRSFAQVAIQFASNYVQHFSPKFLLLRGDAELRHSAGIGILTGVEFVSLVVGVIVLLRWREKRDLFWLGWLAIFPVAASLTQNGIPHALRCIVAIPAIQNIAAIGIESCLARVPTKHSRQTRAFAVLLGLIAFLPFANSYFVSYKSRSAFNWQYGVKQSLEKLRPLSDKIDRIVFYDVVGAEYFTLFYEKFPPREFLAHQFAGTKYVFAPFNAPLDQLYADDKSVAAAYITVPGIPGPRGARKVSIAAPGNDPYDFVATLYLNSNLSKSYPDKD